MRRSISSLVTALVMFIFALPALAHKASDSFMYITAEHIHLDIAVQDMARIQTLDANADAAVSWGELRAVEAEFSELLRRQISLSQNTEPCALLISLEGISEHSDGNYAVWQLASECLSKPGVKLDYSLLFDILLAPLLPATRRKHAGGATQSLRAVFTDVAVVVTMFTLAHSFTLIAASLGWFSLPSQPVEIAIALSISLAAVLALLDVDVRFQRGLAMGVGLIHGFGFAGVLQGLPLTTLAQLALVIIVLPLLYRYSFHPWYQKKAFPLAAIALAVSGLYMALQRI